MVRYTWYTLYEIYPASDKPTFKLLAKLETLRFQAGPCHFDLESGTVALLQDDGHHMWVWYPFDPQVEDSGQDGLVDYSVDHTWDVGHFYFLFLNTCRSTRAFSGRQFREPPDSSQTRPKHGSYS